VPTYEFPALGFDPAPGDPAALDAAAQASRRFAERLATSVQTLNRMRAASWVGESGDAFRAKVKDLPTDLDRARAAHEATASALGGFVSALSQGQTQARTLEQEAAQALRQQQIAASQADTLRGQANAAQEPQRSQLVAQYQSAVSLAGRYGDRLAQLRAQAHRVQAGVSAAADQAAGKVRGAADAPYHEPHWWQKAWTSFMDWVRENADVLRKVSGVLKVVSAICAVLSFVPVVGVFFGAAALMAGGVSVLIDASLKLATGEGSWGMIGLDAALTFIPGGRLTKIVGAPFKAGGRLVARIAPELAEAVAQGGKAASAAIQQGVFQISRLAPRTRALEQLAGEINNLPTAVGRWSVGHAPQAAVTAAEQRFANLVAGGSTPEQAWAALARNEKSAIRNVQRNRFWTNVDDGLRNDQQFADTYGHLFSDADKAALPGRAPRTFDPVTRTEMPVQLSHEPLPISAGGGTQIPREPWQHAAYDPSGFKYPDASYLNDWFRTGRLAPVVPTAAGAGND
jgi:Putative T7SS secretion signal domain